MRYTPQKNGVVERKNRTIMEMACKHFSNEYWAKEVETLVYIMNRCSTKSVKNGVSEKASTCVKDNLALEFFWLCCIGTCSI
jgi:hypothetical protein